MIAIPNKLFEYLSGSIVGRHSGVHVRHIRKTGKMVVAHSGNPNIHGGMASRLAWRKRLGDATKTYWTIVKDEGQLAPYEAEYRALSTKQREKLSLRQFIYRKLLNENQNYESNVEVRTGGRSGDQ